MPLNGRRILLVEDEYLIALDLKSIIWKARSENTDKKLHMLGAWEAGLSAILEGREPESNVFHQGLSYIKRISEAQKWPQEKKDEWARIAGS